MVIFHSYVKLPEGNPCLLVLIPIRWMVTKTTISSGFPRFPIPGKMSRHFPRGFQVFRHDQFPVSRFFSPDMTRVSDFGEILRVRLCAGCSSVGGIRHGWQWMGGRLFPPSPGNWRCIAWDNGQFLIGKSSFLSSINQWFIFPMWNIQRYVCWFMRIHRRDLGFYTEHNPRFGLEHGPGDVTPSTKHPP